MPGKMSWDSYITNMTSTGHVAEAVVAGVQGGVWAKSANLNVSDAEIKNLAAGISDPSKFQTGGVHVGGIRYMFLRMNPDGTAVYGKKGPAGVCVYKSTQAVVIGMYSEGMQPGQCNVAVEKVGDYLKGAGY